MSVRRALGLAGVLLLRIGIGLVLLGIGTGLPQGCAGTWPSSRPDGGPASSGQDTALQAALALSCAGEVSPGLARVADAAMDAGADTAHRVLGGLLGAGDVIARGIACYLRAQALARSQAGELDPTTDAVLLSSRARRCEEAIRGPAGEACTDHRQMAAWLLLAPAPPAPPAPRAGK